MPTEPVSSARADAGPVHMRSRAIRWATAAIVVVVLLVLTPLPAQAQNSDCGPTDAVRADIIGFDTELTDVAVEIQTDAKGVTVVSTTGEMFGYYHFRALTVRGVNGRYISLGAVTTDGELVGWGWAPGHSLSYDGCTASSTNALALIVFYGWPELDLISMAATDAV